MHRTLCITLIALVTVLSPSVLPAFEIPKDITIKRPASLEPMSTWVTPVQFPHGLHAAVNPCVACHHEETNKTVGAYVPCVQCHDQPGIEDPMSFYAAWHAKNPASCVGCHWQKRLHKQAMPPLSCTRGCHKKQ